ncbi:hypothetical protein ACL6C3_08485 [Capilliphycus salinus ALCB114379]|uniref:hypothetical protein n=1 Tax=Capilliphycus salinus TaxID=2768948 RepID=UPI0039A41B3B
MVTGVVLSTHTFTFNQYIILPHKPARVHRMTEVVAKFHNIIDVMHPTFKTNLKMVHHIKEILAKFHNIIDVMHPTFGLVHNITEVVAW